MVSDSWTAYCNDCGDLECVRRPEIKSTFLRQYISRYLFLRNSEEGKEVPNFLKEVTLLSQPQQLQSRPQRIRGASVTFFNDESPDDVDNNVSEAAAGPPWRHYENI